MGKATHDANLDVLGTVPLFAGLDRKHLRRVGQLCSSIEVEPTTVLCAKGRSGAEFFIVRAGEAVVSVDATPLGEVGPGDFFGELALLGGGPRTATVTAKTPMTVLVLSGGEFSALLRVVPEIAVHMLPAIGARIRETTQRDGRPLGA
jgi:CRP/FNR family cyclic AMP-dependent transcriptional regulator